MLSTKNSSPTRTTGATSKNPNKIEATCTAVSTRVRKQRKAAEPAAKFPKESYSIPARLLSAAAKAGFDKVHHKSLINALKNGKLDLSDIPSKQIIKITNDMWQAWSDMALPKSIEKVCIKGLPDPSNSIACASSCSSLIARLGKLKVDNDEKMAQMVENVEDLAAIIKYPGRLGVNLTPINRARLQLLFTEYSKRIGNADPKEIGAIIQELHKRAFSDTKSLSTLPFVALSRLSKPRDEFSAGAFGAIQRSKKISEETKSIIFDEARKRQTNLPESARLIFPSIRKQQGNKTYLTRATATGSEERIKTALAKLHATEGHLGIESEVGIFCDAMKLLQPGEHSYANYNIACKHFIDYVLNICNENSELGARLIALMVAAQPAK